MITFWSKVQEAQTLWKILLDLSLTYNPTVGLHKTFHTAFLRSAQGSTEIMQQFTTTISVATKTHSDGDRKCTEMSRVTAFAWGTRTPETQAWWGKEREWDRVSFLPTSCPRTCELTFIADIYCWATGYTGLNAIKSPLSFLQATSLYPHSLMFCFPIF